MSKFVETEYGSTQEILKFPDHYVALAVMVSDDGVVANDNGKKIVSKGTIVGGASNPVLENLDEAVVDKFVAAIAAVAASLATGDSEDDNDLYYTAKEAGADGNDITIEYVDPRSPTVAAAVAVAVSAITVTLANSTAVLASTTTGVEGDNNGLTWTSKLPGVDGNDIVVVLQDPAGNEQELAITVTGKTIMASLATDGAGAITTTGVQLKAAIEADEDANALVTVEHTGASTGAAAVVDEVADLDGGDDGAVESTAADIVAALEGDDDAMALVDVEASETDTGVVEAMAATNLAGGVDAAAASVTGAEGVLMNDVDVTYGAKEGALIIHGFVAIDKLPYDDDNADAAAAAESVLDMIHFIK